jgi:hypothetical protein
MTKQELNSIENNEMKLHRIRTKVVTFKQLALKVFESNAMTYDQFLELDIAAQVSDDYNDALTLNKLTVLFSNNNLN